MNTLERQARDDEIVSLKARGLTYKQIAAALDIDRTTAIEAVKRFRESNPTLRQHDPIKIVDEMVEGYQADLNELAMISNATANEAVRVGAVNARMAARDRIVGLLQAVGVLPHDLGRLRLEVDVRYIAERVVTVLEKYNLPESAHDELLELLSGSEPMSKQ